MKYLFIVILSFLIACSNGTNNSKAVNDLTSSSSQLFNELREDTCDNFQRLIVLKEILTNRRFALIKTKTSGINQIIWLNKFGYFDPEQPDPTDSMVNTHNFNYVFTQDFISSLDSTCNLIDPTNNQFAQRLNNLKSKVFITDNVNFSFEVKVEGSNIEVRIDYIFPQIDEDMDPNTVLIYKFRMDGCTVFIEDAMMVG